MFYQLDSTTHLKGCGKSTTKVLKEHHINTVSKLKALLPDNLKQIGGISKERVLMSLHEAAQACLDMDAPTKIDFSKAQNPYLAKFGKEKWEEEIAKSRTLSAYCCVTKMIEHIIAESQRCFLGTTHENDWYFFQDALSLMTATETIEWMIKEDHYKRWILPVNGLQDDNPALRKYRMRPVGDSPEFMPWDTSLNNDVHCAVDRHVTMTNNMAKDDKDKFDLSTLL